MSKFSERQSRWWSRNELKSRRSPDHPAVKEYVQSRLNMVWTILPKADIISVLDTGCGNGYFTHALENDFVVTGIDKSRHMLAMNPGKNLHLMDAESLLFPENQFDLVFCHALLHHVEDELQVIREMRRVSRKFVVIMEPNRKNPLMFLHGLLVPAERKSLRFNPYYLKTLALEAGLSVIDTCAFGLLVPNKTPLFLLPILRKFNCRFSIGVTAILVAEKGLVE
jgi:SAM-dependent methyltransferase